MPDFSFLENPLTKQWIVSAPRRAKRPNVADGFIPACPFCPAQIDKEESVYEVTERTGSQAPKEKSPGDSPWSIKVIKNKFPFAPIHEVIILSPHHTQNFDRLPHTQVELVFQTYRQRFQTHEAQGNVYIFHNHGQKGGESLPHPHTQLAVIPSHVTPQIPPLADPCVLPMSELQETDHFLLSCPRTSQWPDEVWVSPKKQGKAFGDLSNDELSDLSFVVSRLVRIFKLRHGDDYPYNFYIAPFEDWYLRLIPRHKTLGGFEIGTGIFVNTQDPLETISFIKEHFMTPDEDKIRREHQAQYHHTA
ncbi:galactose-1-phosphate uridylyltransferase [soil metagenome]